MLERRTGAAGGARRMASALALAALAALTVPAAAQTPRTADRLLPETPGRVPATGATPATPAVLPELDEATARGRYLPPDLLDAAIDPATYVLGPGDVLALVLLVGDTRTMQIPVLPEGVVVVPNVGPVTASGRTLAQFRTDLQKAVAQRYRDFEIYCHLARQRQFRVYVTGEVREPGMLAARPTDRVSDVIERAGGLTERASKRDLELLAADGTQLAPVDLARFLARGELAANPIVPPGAVVRVPPRGATAIVTGEVRVSGAQEVRPGDTVRDLIDLAGGPTTVADLAQVSVERTGPGGDVRLEVCDLRAGSPAADDVTRVTILSTLLGNQRVYFITPDDRQQTLFLTPGETLADLVRRTATLPTDADLAGAQLATRDTNGAPLQVPVDLNRVLRGEQDRVLQDGDVLSVPNVKGYVYVSGYVNRPGRFPYRAEWTVNDYLGEAGGPASGGSRDHVTLLDAEGGQRAAGRDMPVQRGQTVYVDRSTGAKALAGLGILINLSALAVSLVALAK